MQPREKIRAKGPAALTNHELLKAVIGSGNAQANVSKIASSALAVIEKRGAEIDYETLQVVQGLGAAKITEILAAIELSRRFLVKSEQPVIDSPTKVYDLLHDMRDMKQEHFIALTLDGANRLIHRHTISVGTLTSSLVHPREVFAPAICDRAAAVIVAHNHPSGNLDPSEADKETTSRLRQAALLLGLVLVDHLIIAKGGFCRL